MLINPRVFSAWVTTARVARRVRGHCSNPGRHSHCRWPSPNRMRYCLRNQETNLASYLPEMRSRRLVLAPASSTPRKKLAMAIPGADGLLSLEQCNLDFLFRYDVFPRRILTFFGEWEFENRHMQPGDVIVQQASIPPGWVGFKVIFGVRVLSVYRDAREAGFSYGTLQGHPEVGTNAFCISLRDGLTEARVETAAGLATLAARIFGPIFTRPYVDYCNRQALQTIAARFMNSCPVGHSPRQ